LYIDTIRRRLSGRRAAIAVMLASAMLGIGYSFSPPTPPVPSKAEVILPTQTPQPISTPTAKPISTATRPIKKATLPPRSATVTPTATSTPAPVMHVVRSGEMLLAVAAQYDTSVEKIMMVNEITDPTTLQIGQELLIPVTATPANRATPNPTPTLVFHTIEPGDTLLAIALTNDTTVEALMAVNWLTDPGGLQIGQKLVVPPADGSLPDAILWAPTTIHQVEGGDTILDLALEYGSSVEDILTANPSLKPDTLQIGQQVAIPLTRQKANPGFSHTAATDLPAAPTLSKADLAALKKGSPSLVGLEQALVQAVNAERQADGLALYTVDEQLAVMAWGQAQDMVKRGYFGHITPEGRTLRHRFQDRDLADNRVGENIYLSVKPANQAVQAAIGWFMGDAPHRRNILHPNFKRIGVGVAQEVSGWYTFVLVFAGD
jgi:uncharacterized protein YkwD